ncbi:MAG: hypothetical protein AAF533_26555 [Acidobacteriota bacterium]
MNVSERSLSNASIRRAAGLVVSLGALLATLPSPDTLACAEPPTPPDPNPQLISTVLPDRTIVREGETVTFFLATTNFGEAWRSPPFRADNTRIEHDFQPRLVRFAVPPPEGDCFDPSNVTDLGPVPAEWTRTLTLDDAYSPYADGPAAAVVTATLTVPEDTGASYGIQARLVSRAHAVELIPNRSAVSRDIHYENEAQTCVLITGADDPVMLPSARFSRQVNAGAAGDWVHTQVVVDRNGYEPTDELRVVVERENVTDPIDLFPIEPNQLVDGGVVLHGDSAAIDMACGLHYPCFVGMANRLHVTIYDGDFPVWRSQATYQHGIGEACVARAPAAHLEVLEVSGALNAAGELTDCGDVEMYVRAYGRNPTIGSRWRDLDMWLGFPEGVEILDVSRPHHHDNPMDSHEHPEHELYADADVFIEGSELFVHAPELEHRFHRGAWVTPTKFDDLLEVEVRIRIPQALLAELDSFDFFGPWVVGYLDRKLYSDVGDEFSLPIRHGGDTVFPGLGGLSSRGCEEHEVAPGDIRTGTGEVRPGSRTLGVRGHLLGEDRTVRHEASRR